MKYSEKNLRNLIRDLHVSKEIQKIEEERLEHIKRNKPTFTTYFERRKNSNGENKL